MSDSSPNDVQTLKESVAVLASNQEHLFKANDKTNESLHEVSISLTELAKELRSNTESNRHVAEDVRGIKQEVAEIKGRVRENEIQVKGLGVVQGLTKKGAFMLGSFIFSILLLSLSLYLRAPDSSEEIKKLTSEQHATINRLADIVERMEARE